MTDDILQRLTQVAIACNTAKLWDTKLVVQDAFTEITRLRNENHSLVNKITVLKIEALNLQQVHQQVAESQALSHSHVNSTHEPIVPASSPAPLSEPETPLDLDDEDFDDDTGTSSEEDEEAMEAEAPAPEIKPFALKMPNGQYFQSFAFADWDVHLHRVGAVGFPGVWNEAMARSMATCFSKLGQSVEVVDCYTLAPNGLKRAW